LSKPVKGAILLSENAGNLRMAVEFLCSCCQAAAAGAASARLGQIPSLAEETGMAMQLGHVHIKTREDPQKVAKFYIDNFGATVKREIPGRGCQLDLHGVQLNVTTIIACRHRAHRDRDRRLRRRPREL
jgi:hypothetical protein